MSTTPLGRFLRQLNSLSDVLLMLYPDNKYFVKAKNYLEIGISANPRLVHTLFSEHVMKFKEEILEQKDSFFMQYCQDKEKRDELQAQNSDLMSKYNVKTDVVDTILEQCGQLWTQLEAEQQNTIWKYLKVLVVLSERV